VSLAEVSLISVFVGLALLIVLAYKGHSTIWVAPVCAVVVAAFSGLNLLDAYMGDYMRGTTDYIFSWFPAFFLGAVYGKIMDLTGSARSLANKLIGLIGPKFAVLAVILPCMLMTYGGISLFVVVFVVYPMGYAIYRAADLPRTLLPSAIALGAFGVTMMAIPGSPQIQNIIPTEYFGTTPAAAPLMGIISAVLMFVPGYLYLEYRVRQVRKAGLGFTEDPKHKELEGLDNLPSWHWLCGLVPLIVVVLMLNLLPKALASAGLADWTPNQAVVVALLGGIAVACAMNAKQAKRLMPAINLGAQGSVGAIMNTACAVGFGAVIKAVPGFELLKNALLNMPGNILFTEAVTVNVLAGATGSASGGMTIVLEAMAGQFMANAAAAGISPELLHRVAAMASGGLDTLPHNGAVLTLLAVSNCTHKESYKDLFIACVIPPVTVGLVIPLIWGLFI